MEQAIADSAALGVILSEEDIAAIAEQTPPDDFMVWPVNWDAVVAFHRCLTQWRTGPAGYVGMDYGVVLEVLRLYDVPDHPVVLEKVRTMEAEALRILNRKEGEK